MMAFRDLLVHRATVYDLPAASDSQAVLQSDLPMRVDIGTGVNSADQRVQLALQATLIWGPEYRIPDHAQVEVAGDIWNVIAGTVTPCPVGFSSAVHHYECQAVKVMS